MPRAQLGNGLDGGRGDALEPLLLYVSLIKNFGLQLAELVFLQCVPDLFVAVSDPT